MGNAANHKRRIGRLALAGLVSFALINFAVATFPSPATRAGAGPPTLPRLIGNDVQSGQDPELAHVVSVLAGRRTTVWCWSREDWNTRTAGLQRRYPGLSVAGPWRAYTTVVPRPVVHFSPQICAGLTALAASRRPVQKSNSTVPYAWAVATLAHEAAHASGVFDERAATCYGAQSIRRASMLLGQSGVEGQHLAELYWTRWYRWHDHNHRSSECRNDGRLDIRRHTNIWP